MPEDARPDPSRPSHFGEYELLEQIGRGGMGVVYKARQISLKRPVALKMLGPHASAFPGIADRLRAEAEVAGSLHHPQIVTIYDVGEHEGHPFFTMELIDGSGLDRFIGPDGFRPKTETPEADNHRSGPEAEIARIMIQIARAVDHAHKYGVLHRDLKPANVLIDAKGDPHLTDFGLAKVLGRAATTGTASGAVLGTPAYMAPEQASGGAKHASTAADIYSLGAILYEMLTGHPPFRAETPLETLRRVVEEQPKPPSTFNRNLDGDLAIICLKCLEKDPSHRYASALAMAEDLERWLRGEPIEGRSVGAMERTWRWCLREPKLASLVGGVFLLLTAVAVLSFSLYQGGKARVATAERQKADYHRKLLNRIENEWKEAGRVSVKISAAEFATIVGREEAAAGVEEKTVILGLHANLLQPDQFLSRWGPLVNFFYTNRATIDGPRLAVGLVIYASRSNAIEGLIKGEVDMMRVDPAVYVLARQRHAQATPLVQEVYGAGEIETGAAIFTRTNSGIDDIRNLQNRSIVFGEAISALGDALPKAELVQAGLLVSDFLRITNLHNDAVLAAVGGGEWDAGVSSLDYISPLAKPGGQFRIVSKLRSPGYPWLATTNLTPSIAEAFKSTLLSLHDSNLLAQLETRLTRFESVRPSDYDVLEKQMEKAKLFPRPR